MKVLCLGGNVCLGARGPRGWPEHLWELTGAQVVNAAIRGARLVDVVRAIPMIQVSGPDLVVIQVGAYDARGGGTPPTDFLALLMQGQEACLDRWPDCEVAICTPTPIGQSQLPGFNRSARRWVERVAPLVEQVEAIVVRLHDLSPDLFADGVHPTQAGAREIASRVAQAFDLVQPPGRHRGR